MATSRRACPSRHRGLLGIVLGLAAGMLARRHVGPGTHGRRVLVRDLRHMERRARRLAGRGPGLEYRLRRRHPDPDVPDDVLADRVRTSLGRVTGRLDLPHVHVTSEHHVVLLHGEVATAEQAALIEKSAASVSGVAAVRSFLHVGLIPGDTRPSVGARPTPSAALRRLHAAVVQAGADPDRALGVLRVVLAAFTEQLPHHERAHFLGHLPDDVRALATPSRRRDNGHFRRVGDLVVSVVSAGSGLPLGRAEHVIESVLGCLHELVPEEVVDISAVLPADLRVFWEAAVPS